MVNAVYCFCRNGLMVGFFLPGDSLLFVAGIYSKMLVGSFIPMVPAAICLTLQFLWILTTVAGILGNTLAIGSD
jgi:membrane-associated protein